MSEATDAAFALLMIGLSVAADPALTERAACWTRGCPDLVHDLAGSASALPRCPDAMGAIDACVALPVILALAKPAPRAFFLKRLKYVLGLRLLILLGTSLPAPSGCDGPFAHVLDGTCAQMGCSGHVAVALLACLALTRGAGLPLPLALGYAALVSVFVVASGCHYLLCAATAWLLVFALDAPPARRRPLCRPSR